MRNCAVQRVTDSAKGRSKTRKRTPSLKYKNTRETPQKCTHLTPRGIKKEQKEIPQTNKRQIAMTKTIINDNFS